MNLNGGIMSHEQQILRALKKGAKLTKLGSLKRWGCINTGGRICELRKKGYNIITKMIARRGKTYAQYSLAK